jgi:hypothetical protein
MLRLFSTHEALAVRHGRFRTTQDGRGRLRASMCL